MSNISEWNSTAASNNTAAPDGFPEDMAPSGVNNAAREVMAAIRRWYEDAQWIDRGDTPTFATASTFTLSGDLTATYDVGRRIRCTDSSTLYGEITASSYSAPDTTVTVSLDSGSLSASLSAVSISAISGTNQSIVTPGTRLDGAGIAVIRGDQNVDLDQRGVYLQHLDGTTRGELSHNGTTTTLNLINYVPGGDVAVFGHTTGGALRVLWAGNANDGVDGYYQNVVSIRTVAASSGGLTANNTLTGAGFERVLTVSDATPALTVLSTPEVISTGLETSGSWNTVNNTTLANAGATAAKIRISANDTLTSDATDYVYVYIRETGSSLPVNSQTLIGADINRASTSINISSQVLASGWVTLDGNQDFDYYINTLSGNATVTVVLEAYIV